MDPDRYAYSHHSQSSSPSATQIFQTGLRLAAQVYAEMIRQWNNLRPRNRRDNFWTIRRVLSIPNFLILGWVVLLYWGERIVFNNSIDACDWSRWEAWPEEANPHHLAFVADPQIVDPHTYPSRPWPLSTLTYTYTDIYMTRVYSMLQTDLYPDTTIFLGDLFDGGREWGTLSSPSPESRWEKFNHLFWLREYERFGDMFVKTWQEAGVAGRKGQGLRRKLVLTLPGNHDLGFAEGVSHPVRKRYYAYFGEGNRVDIIANHTLVSIDALSLSAKGRPGFDAISEPVDNFLDNVRPAMRSATARELKELYDQKTDRKYTHGVIDTPDLAQAKLPAKTIPGIADLPTILLSHIPLYRDKGAACGPFREHNPQQTDAQGQPIDPDERNAIPIEAGHQYQNVLSLDISKLVTEKIGNIRYAFSGDDHDYCDLTHRGYTSGGGGIREITVKSLSWAMGVRKPGFVMLSMWNPIDSRGNSILQGHESQETIQSHLCLVPDQLSIFIRYGIALVVTLSVLLLRASHFSLNPSMSGFAGSESPLLPMMEILPRSSSIHDKQRSDSSISDDALSSSSSSSSEGLSARHHAARTRSISPIKRGGYGLPSPALQTQPFSTAKPAYFERGGRDEEQRSGLLGSKIRGKGRRLKGLGLFHAELRWSVFKTVVVVSPWYIYLLRN